MSAAQHTPGPWQILSEEADKAYIRVRGTRLGMRYKVANVPTPDHEGVHPREVDETRANAHLIAAAPDLLAAWTMGSQADTPTMLDWVADRLVHVYGESPNIDFVLTLRERAAAGRAAIAKATGSAA